MKINKDIEIKIEKSFEVLDHIQEVKVNSTFKQNVLQKIAFKEEEVFTLQWFTPKFQIAVMCIVLLVNISALVYTFSASATDTTSMATFAKEYNLSSNESMLN